MQIIMPTVLLIGLTNVLGLQIMVPIGKEKMVFYSVLAGGIADFVANMIFIPTMSAAGAALGTLIAETVVLIVQLIVLRRLDQGFVFRSTMGKSMCIYRGSRSCLLWSKSTEFIKFYSPSNIGYVFLEQYMRYYF